jgi:hypothetical protein
LLKIASFCANESNCKTCALKALCGRPISDWSNQ